MTAGPYEQARPPLDRIPETTEQLGGRPAPSDSLARDHDSPTTRASAPLMPTKNTVPTRILTRPRRSPPPPSRALFGTLADQGRLRTVDYTAVTPNPNQPRKLFEQDALERLAESIRARGLLQPLIVCETEPGSFRIIAGERRWRALGIIEAETVDVLVSENQDDATALQDALIENVVREDLTPIEKGRGYASLIEDLGLTREELARRLGESRVTISHHLRLLDLPDDTQELINARELTYAHGRVLLMTDDHTERRRLARDAVANDWSTRQLETAVRALATPRARKPKRRHDADQAALALRLGDAVSSATGLEITVKPGARQSFAFTVVGADAARTLAQRLGAHEVDSSMTT